MFHIAGGGCAVEPAYVGNLYITEIRADNVVLAQREVNSPDAVSHSPFFKSGTNNKCSDLSAPYGSTIELGDATVGTVYIKAGTSAGCFAGSRPVVRSGKLYYSASSTRLVGRGFSGE